MLESSSSLFVEAPALGVLIPGFPGLPPGGVPVPGCRLTPEGDCVEEEGLVLLPVGVEEGCPPDGTGVGVAAAGVLLLVE